MMDKKISKINKLIDTPQILRKNRTENREQTDREQSYLLQRPLLLSMDCWVKQANYIGY